MSAPSERPVVRDLLLAVIRLGRLFRQQSESTLAPAQFSALITLRLHGPLRSGELAELESVALPAVTRTVNGLVEAGLVERIADQSDGRARQLQLSEAGRQQLSQHWLAGESLLNQRIEQLSAEELQVLRAALPVMHRLTGTD